jgi:type IV pilus assembly protein PilB
MIVTQEELKALLQKTNLIDDKNWNEIVEYAENCDISVPDALIEKNIISDENLGVLIADYLKVPFIILSKYHFQII